MGTNYYARIIPSAVNKRTLKKLIDDNDFRLIREEVSRLYGSFHPYTMQEIPVGEIHLGKASGGWKFLWNPNVYAIRNGHLVKHEEDNGGYSTTYVPDPDTAYYVYPLTKEGIKAFIDRDDVEIYDEYGEKQDKDEFFKMALEWTTWEDKDGKIKEAWDAASYEKEHPNESRYKMDTELTRLLESEGFTFTSDTCNDFYSDGLRFSTSTDFC